MLAATRPHAAAAGAAGGGAARAQRRAPPPAAKRQQWRSSSRQRSVSVCASAPQAPPATTVDEVLPRPGTPGLGRDELKKLSAQYSLQMQDAMGWPKDKLYAYSMERGLYFHEVLPNLFCGSQPRHAQDVEQLHAMGVRHVVSLQESKDAQHWGVDLNHIRHRCAQLGIEHIRRPVRDFDPHSLRKVLPSAVQALHRAHSSGDKVYVHCTAGLGRAPGVVIAYMYWFYDLSLDEAYELLTSIRPCGPKKEAVRGATHDLWHPNHLEGLDRHPRDAFTRLSAHDRHVLQSKVVQGHFHHHHHHHH